MKRLYAGLELRGPGQWKSCFTPLNHFTVMEYVDKTWKPWLMEFPANGLEPGIGPMLALAPLPLLVQFLITLENAFHRSELPAYINPGEPAPKIAEFAAVELLGRPPVRGEPLLSVARKAAQTLPADPSKIADADRRMALDTLIATGRDQVASAIGAAPDTDEMRRLGIFYDLALTMARGIVADGLFLRGFSSLSTARTGGNGSKSPLLQTREHLESAVVRGCYDYAFASRTPGIGAGTATLLALRFILSYKGSVLHALTAPMGDNIIAPFYQYLRYERKVKFEFFCRVKKLRVVAGGADRRSSVLAHQVLLKNGAYYNPLIQREDGAWSWPSAPDTTQIVNGDALKEIDLESAWTPWQDAISERVLHATETRRARLAARTVRHRHPRSRIWRMKSICFDFGERFPAWREFLGKSQVHPDSRAATLAQTFD